MSTLGGNRGERDKNAKPKFQQLDINSLYRSSRGETSEPTTQKNAVPRKHGMQSLGKVPSARRPPANLPSLKAETSSPVNAPTQISEQQQQQTSNSSSASWVDSGAAPPTSGASQASSQLNTSTGSANLSQTTSGGSGSAANTSWSAVATGSVKEETTSQPPIYQSPQFQNEFPSLDGSVTSNASANATGLKQQNPNSNSHDSGEHMNLRPSTDVASWMQQQQSNSGNARGSGGENGQLGNYQQPEVAPTKFMALMPKFMRGSQNSSSQPHQQQQQQHSQPSNQSNQGSGGGGGNYQNQARSNRNYGGSSYNDYSNGPPRHRQGPPPRHSGGRHHDDRSSSYEPEVIVQRPIIKEEELERIDSLARDEGWSKHDEIDYNKKIQYSDDEPDDVKPKDDKKMDAWRDSDKKQQNGPVGRSVDQALAERMRLRREDEERLERERKMNAQKKLQELEEKSKNKSSDKEVDDRMDFEKKSMDYGKKYVGNNDKYDSYDNYGRGAPANDFKKSAFQSNLPPRFQKQQNFDRNEDRRSDKPGGPPGYKPLHQQDSKNVPFTQQSSYEQRWTYNKQSQQAPPTRRNVSSLSQSSSDDNRRDNNKGYGRRRQESEEDDYRYAKEPTKKPVQQAQITRSMSDSSDKLSDHNRSEKSTSREYLGANVCWAEVCENDKRQVDTKSRRVSESSAMSDDQPRTILQRNKPLHDQLHGKDVKKDIKDSADGDKKTVLNESLPKELDEKKNQEKAAEQGSVEQKKSLESIPEKDQGADKTDNAKDSKPVKEAADDNRHKKSPRSNRYERDPRSGPPTRGNYGGGYRGGNNWQGGRRGGGHQRGGRYDYSDSENSDEYDQDWNRNGPKGPMGRKDQTRDGRSNFHAPGSKEGFSPRGEPSRRGRGGAAVSGPQSSGFRRSGSNGSAVTAPAKNYGPPSSKSPFGSNDEKSSSEKRDTVKEKSSDDDRMKQKQKALSDGLMNKSQKETTNVATKASSPAAVAKPDEPIKQHSTEPAGEQKDKKLVDDDKNSMGQRTTSGSSYTSNQGRNQKPTTAAVTKPGTKPPQTNPMASGKPITTAPSHQYSSSMQKPMEQRDQRDQRHQMNRSNDPRIDPRGANNSNNNSHTRPAPRFTNKRENMPPGNGPTGNMNRMTGSYWDKNHQSDQMHHMNDDKMSMMQMNSSSGPQSGMHPNQQNNLLNSKTDVMKQQNQQQPPPSMQQQNQNQPMLDGASLKTTLIFENTSYKSGPPAGIKRPQGPPPMGQQKPQENTINTINDMIDQQAKEQSLSSALQNLSFGQQKPQNDMDINFPYSFDAQMGLLGDDRNKSGFGVVSSGSNTNVHPSQAVSKSSSLGLVGAKTGMQNSNILNTDALNMKVASCKKVWEEPSVSMEHGGSASDDVMSNFVAQQQHLHQYGHNNMSAHHTGLSPGPQSYGGYGTSSSNDHNSSLEHFSKSNDVDDVSSYPSPGQQQHMSANMVHSQSQQANMNMKAAEAFASSANVCKVKPTQQQMHQAGLSPPPQMQQSQLQQQQQTYYSTPNYQNMSTIPSPPAVVYNSQPATGGLYNPYSLDAARAQMYGYPTGGTVGANNSMSFNAFMQTPNLTSAPTHEMYQNLSQYRAAVQPFNQTPQLNNPSAAVLISSATASNSMMNSKPNSQIGAIGSKSSQSGGQAPASGQYGQQYMNHLYHQHQSSYYTNSTAQQANPYYSGPANTGGAAAGNYGMFPSHGTNVSNGPPPQPQQMANFGSVGQFPIGSQMLSNLVINQQYRSGPVVNSGNNGNSNASGSNSNAPPSGYMKQQHQSQLQDAKLSSPSMTDANPSHKMYNNQNWDSSSAPSNNFNSNRMYGSNQNSGGMQSQGQRWATPGPIQRPSCNGFNVSSPSSQFVNYQQSYPNSQQRPMRNTGNQSMNNSGTSMKSQYFNAPAAGTKLKSDGDKTKPQAAPSLTKVTGDPKVDT